MSASEERGYRPTNALPGSGADRAIDVNGMALEGDDLRCESAPPSSLDVLDTTRGARHWKQCPNGALVSDLTDRAGDGDVQGSVGTTWDR